MYFNGKSCTANKKKNKTENSANNLNKQGNESCPGASRGKHHPVDAWLQPGWDANPQVGNWEMHPLSALEGF